MAYPSKYCNDTPDLYTYILNYSYFHEIDVLLLLL